MICISCGQDNWERLYKNLLRCKKCRFVRARDKFFMIDPKTLYKKKYFKKYEYFDYEKERAALEKNFSNRLQRILPLKSKGRLLEVGCAYGYFLALARKYFEVVGFEVDGEIAKKASSFCASRVLTGKFTKNKFDGRFDVICMFDVIEHLKDPLGYLKKIYSLLNKNGIIVIETGDIESLLAKIQGERWRLISPPFHLQYFSRNSLAAVLKKVGFKAIHATNSISFYRTLGQTLYRLGLLRFKRFAKIFYTILLPTYTFDLTFLTARK